VGLTNELAVASDAAVRAGAVLTEYFTSGALNTRSKDRRQDVVTDADLASERLLVETLTRHWPDDAVLAEESGSRLGSSGRQWCIDPLDGTANFAAGVPHWAVALCLLEGDRPVLSVTYDPSRDELFTTTRHLPTRLDGWDVRVSRVEAVEDALVAMNLPYADRVDHAVDTVTRGSRGLRETGSMALDLAWVAAGRFQLALHAHNGKLWDYAGGEFLVEQAGGVSAPLPGRPDLVAVGGPGVVHAFRSSIERITS
jgi:myo-inositol-1(or 4)-monophosphatase